jgi:predicted RNase H-like nuclease (RuvC/YqgF family)
MSEESKFKTWFQSELDQKDKRIEELEAELDQKDKRIAELENSLKLCREISSDIAKRHCYISR